MAKIKVLAVCGFGVGTSLILKMNIEKVLKQNGIDAEVTNADITTATGINADVIFTSKELYSQLQGKSKVPLIQIDNFMNNKEIEEKGMPVIKGLM
ncbi:PTS sugar transporter subunit IIB [Vallitalea maricola]|uniref:PTS sugar transporter subunit IIB n=1 Tax=Vallitalea maricola TaxID=3074433 RepID=A0ACB5UKZ9_9FIRM|nr:PTS sugar transporter subunit IIB [Vallitalea sp. AN17-2]